MNKSRSCSFGSFTSLIPVVRFLNANLFILLFIFTEMDDFSREPFLGENIKNNTSIFKKKNILIGFQYVSLLSFKKIIN